MKSPNAILIGVALIAAALFFREPTADGFQCWGGPIGGCAVLHGDQITTIFPKDEKIQHYTHKWR